MEKEKAPPFSTLKALLVRRGLFILRPVTVSIFGHHKKVH